ncbi:thiamin biosynthesis protein [Rhizoctonia solani AG-3 Rhs1AP]|uniref:Thiamin biosynthesis protein n=1 Tax=Rhizoctonia solani AG-3 Rhs1AP TaxID=1086054 RepID=X8JS62_9AGAM|nr:thiamin biosynthesis protein [Rhizoctonia solani AG-3 Rhs1AP]
MPKRRATSPPQPASAQTKTARRTEETGDVKGGTVLNPPAGDDHGDRTPTRRADDVSNSSGINSKTNGHEEQTQSARSLSALAPEFVPGSGSTSPVIAKSNGLVQSELPFSSQSTSKTQSRQASKDSEASSPSKSIIRPVFKSEPLQIKDSTFQARLFSLESPAQTPKILAYMRRQYPDFQHHMSAWRYLMLKPGMTGLEGENAFAVEQGWDDDGEKRGGSAIIDVIEKMGLCDVVVVVSRRFGGTLLGPARFAHIADCTRAVCTAMYERERAAERASRVADLVAQLREWDTEVAELRLEIAALEPTKSKVETGADEKGKLPAISVSLKPPDYTSVLSPPDVEKAERLLQARQKTVQSLKAALEKKRAKPDAGEEPSNAS